MFCHGPVEYLHLASIIQIIQLKLSLLTSLCSCLHYILVVVLFLGHTPAIFVNLQARKMMCFLYSMNCFIRFLKCTHFNTLFDRVAKALILCMENTVLVSCVCGQKHLSPSAPICGSPLCTCLYLALSPSHSPFTHIINTRWEGLSRLLRSLAVCLSPDRIS